ncbi:MAG: porin [Verrucomicrobiota bacterium]
MRKQLVILALFGSTAIAAHAQASPQATGLLTGNTYIGDTTYDKLWSLFSLYKDESNPILQEFNLQGRLQVQYADGHNDNGHFDIEDYKNSGRQEAVWGDHLEARRAYFGFKTKWFQNWKVEGQIDVDTDGLDGLHGGHTLYKDIYDLYVTYAPSDAFNASLGKREIKFSREQEISSVEILTFERSMLTNALHPGNLTGVWVNGKGIQEHWLYELGAYGNDQVREFSNFDGGTILTGKIGYDYASQAGLDWAIASLRYMHNTAPGFKSSNIDPNYAAPTTPAFSDCVALTNDLIQGRFGLTTDILYGVGYHGHADQAGKTVTINQSNVYGINLIPSYFIADGLQLVGRLQYAASTDPNGVSLPSRYESSAPSKDKKGNTYTSVYAGLNYYLYGHKLKLMNGIEYSHLGGGDYDGYTFLSGLRFAF